jgi:hypothetical protein
MARYKVCSKTGKFLILDEGTGEWRIDRTGHNSNQFDVTKPVAIMADIKEFVSIAGHKPELITSRSQLARHERSNNMRQVGNDLTTRNGGRVTERAKERDAKRAEIIRKGGIKVSWTDYNHKSV